MKNVFFLSSEQGISINEYFENIVSKNTQIAKQLFANMDLESKIKFLHWVNLYGPLGRSEVIDLFIKIL